jgi:hypothetical protein
LAIAEFKFQIRGSLFAQLIDHMLSLALSAIRLRDLEARDEPLEAHPLLLGKSAARRERIGYVGLGIEVGQSKVDQ